jgi:hypothetical protein
MLSMQTIAIRIPALIVALAFPCVAHAAASDGDSLTTQVVLLVVGWFFGLSSSILVDEYRSRKANHEIRAVLKVELTELQYRMALLVYGIRSRLGIDKEAIRWALGVIQGYKGLNKNPKLQALMAQQLAMSDQEFDIFAEFSKTPQGAAIALMKYSASQLGTTSLSGLDEVLQNRLSEVRVHVGMFNEEVDNARYYLRLTFDKLSDANHDRAVQNLNTAYGNVASRAKIIADHIGQIRWPV